MTPGQGIEPGIHWWEPSALTTAPALLPKYTRITYEDHVYPPWGEAVGWLIIVASMLCVPLLVIKTIVDIYWRGNDGENKSQVGVRCKPM